MSFFFPLKTECAEENTAELRSKPKSVTENRYIYINLKISQNRQKKMGGLLANKTTSEKKTVFSKQMAASFQIQNKEEQKQGGR